MTEKEKIAVSAEEDGTVLMLFVWKSGVLTWTGTPDSARWLAQELGCAADRADGRKAMAKFKEGAA